MDGAKVDACLRDPALHKEVSTMKKVGLEEVGVNSTPSFYLGKTTVIRGFRTYDEMAEAIDAALAKVKAGTDK